MSNIRIGRILHEDKDFVTLEVSKNDQVTFNLQKDEDGNTVGGDQFFTLVFVHAVDGKMVAWNPFDEEA